MRHKRLFFVNIRLVRSVSIMLQQHSGWWYQCLGCRIQFSSLLSLTILVILVMAGWGGEVFTAHNHWWFIPLLSCHLGAILGAGAYLLLVELHWPHQEPLQPPQQPRDHHHLAYPAEEAEKKANAKLPSLTRPGFGSNFLNVSRKFASMPVTVGCRYLVY